MKSATTSISSADLPRGHHSHRRLRKHFSDVFAVAGKRGGPTFKAGPVALRLDHVYVSRGIRVLECRVRNDDLTRVASDHRPVIASVEVTWP